MVRTDIFRRGVPWTLLIKRSATIETDLNVKPVQQLCVALTGLVLLALREPAVEFPWCRSSSLWGRRRSSGSTETSTGSSPDAGALASRWRRCRCTCSISPAAVSRSLIALFQWHILSRVSATVYGRPGPRAGRRRAPDRFPVRSWPDLQGGWHDGQHEHGSRGPHRSPSRRSRRGPRPHRRRSGQPRPGRSQPRPHSQPGQPGASRAAAPIATRCRRPPTRILAAGASTITIAGRAGGRQGQTSRSLHPAGLPPGTLEPAGPVR